MSTNPTAVHFVVATKNKPAKQSALRRKLRPAAAIMERVTREPADLWPSGRGDEIAVLQADFDTVLAGVSLKLQSLSVSPSLFIDHADGLSAVILRQFAGQKAISLLSDTRQFPTTVSVIADKDADAALVIGALQELFAQKLQIVPVQNRLSQ